MEKILIINKFFFFKANQVQVKSNGQTVKQSQPTSGKGKKKGGMRRFKSTLAFFFYILLTSLPSAWLGFGTSNRILGITCRFFFFSSFPFNFILFPVFFVSTTPGSFRSWWSFFFLSFVLSFPFFNLFPSILRIWRESKTCHDCSWLLEEER